MNAQPVPVKAPVGLAQQVRHIISKRKHIRLRRLHFAATLRELNFDLVDVVDIILALERRFHLIIPDEVPLHTIGDFVYCVASYQANGPRKAA